MNFQTLNKQRKLILILAVAGIISIFLPWFSAGAFGFSVHINGFHGWGILAFLCFAVGIAISLIGLQTEPLDKNPWFVAIACGALALLSIIITIASSGGGFGFVSAGFGFGIWIALVAAAGIILSAWMFRNPANDFKSSFESIKNSVSSTASSLSGNTNSSSSSGTNNKIAEIERLSKLRENGSLSEEEFQQLKSKLL
jgi:O-antigen/teichoic acid export membrane protein